jgi:spermidine dehydrogenase
MNEISRRDLLNGAALAIVAGLTPEAQIAAQTVGGDRRYPPALMGLRGQHAGSFETAHAHTDDRSRFAVDHLPAEDRYDLVVVGAGISGLAAAWFYRRAVGPKARILILDANDDFGGHAKRNEFTIDGRKLIGYAGSQSIDQPGSLWSETAKGLLRDLGVDVARFERAFDQTLYSSRGLSRGVFFPRESFGRDALVPGDALLQSGNEATRRLAHARELSEFIDALPISNDSKGQLLELYDGSRDFLYGRNLDQKRQVLKSTSYRNYLIRNCGCNEEVVNCFQGRTLGFFGLGCDAVPAADLVDHGYPGFAGLGLPSAGGARSEPYIYHFPDGNASLARLLVRALVPGVAPGGTMEDVVLAGFNYDSLDGNRAGSIRIRLDSTCIDVKNAGEEVLVGYVRHGRAHRVAARHAVLACFHMMIPHLMGELPASQRAALAQNVKTPIVYTNVVARNWHAFEALKVHSIAAPMSFHSTVALDFPVSLGSYRHSGDPSEPICLHLVHVAGEPNRGLTAREQFRIGQGKLLQMTFADFEARIHDELGRMLGPGGFAPDRDIAAITVNRWPHGYGYVENSLFDPDNYGETIERARQKAGRVAVANSDAGGDAYAHLAIDQAARAISELVG